MARPDLLEIDGLDFAPYVEEDGLQWEQNDISSENSGRTMDGTMHMEWVAVKLKLTVALIPVEHSTALTLLAKLQPGWKEVTVVDAYYGSYTGTFYVGSRKANFSRYHGADGSMTWDSVSFSLIER